MSNEKDEIRIEKITKETRIIQKQVKEEDKLKRESGIRRLSVRNKLKTERKKRIMHLNIVQTIILVVVILAEILSVYGYISKVFSIIGPFILCVSCVVVMKKIKKSLQL